VLLLPVAVENMPCPKGKWSCFWCSGSAVRILPMGHP